MTQEAPQLYKNYPSGCTDKELKSAVASYANYIYKECAQTNIVLQCTPLVQLGLSELQGRFTKRTMWASLIIAVASLIMSGTAVYLSFQALDVNESSGIKEFSSKK